MFSRILATKKTLLQTHVDSDVAKKFDAMAAKEGHNRASYLRLLVRLHVQSQLATPRTPHEQKRSG
jgi:uncharacterized protein YigA (DUF484 family)